MENSPKVLKKHYWKWETLGPQAEIYWALAPKTVLRLTKTLAKKNRAQSA